MVTLTKHLHWIHFPVLDHKQKRNYFVATNITYFVFNNFVSSWKKSWRKCLWSMVTLHTKMFDLVKRQAHYAGTEHSIDNLYWRQENPSKDFFLFWGHKPGPIGRLQSALELIESRFVFMYDQFYILDRLNFV